jgi:phage gp16-like protein
VRAVSGGKTKQDHRTQAITAVTNRRRALLAIIHIARKEMGLTDDQYDAILSGFKAERTGKPAESAKDLTILQLENMVKYMKHLGFKHRKRWRNRMDKTEESQIMALHERARELASMLENGEKRLAGLCKSICGVSVLDWCKDIKKLERLLKVLGEILEQ